MEKIKVEEILKRHNFNVDRMKDIQPKDGKGSYHFRVMSAIKEIVEAVVDKCAKEASVRGTYKTNEGYLAGGGVNKQSILQVKQMIDYE